MRILFVSLDVPLPPDRGQRMRNWSILRALVAEGHEVSLISFAPSAEPNGDRRRLGEVCRTVELVPLPLADSAGFLGYLHRIRALFSPIPYGAWRFRSPTLAASVRAHLARRPCDVVIWDEVYNLENLPADPGVPVVLNSHDIMQVIWRRYLGVERNPLKRVYAALEYAKLRRWEAPAHHRVRKVLAVSSHDAGLIRRLCPGLAVEVVPNTVDTSQYEPAGTDDGKTVLFVGGMDWFPNRDAAEFFIGDVFPRLRRLVPDARFAVVGRPPSEAVRARLQAPGVEFLGRVPDIRPVVARAAVCVVPLRIGSGVRWKILEAAAMGKAIVSTALGAEGLDFRDGEDILLADQASALATALSQLLGDPSRRRQLGVAARCRVERQYNFDSLKSGIRTALSQYERGLRDSVVG